MRLADDVRQSVVYIGHESGGKFTPTGTGFVLDMGIGREGLYLVTAAHVAMTLDDRFDIRLNNMDGKTSGIDHRGFTKWYYHPTDDTADVAVTRYNPPSWADVIPIPFSATARAEKLQTKNIGTGDLTYVVGVLHFMAGTVRNIPAVHTGHIVMMPDERIPVSNWRSKHGRRMEISAYLVSAAALPGSSGSPVFVRRSIKTRLFDKEIDANPGGIQIWHHGSLWLLGVWRGAWFGKKSDGLSLPRNADGRVPLGLGTVAPTVRLLEVLNQPELQEMRQREKDMKEGFVEKPTSVERKKKSKPSKTREAANPNHREDFDRLLTKAVTPKK